MGFPGLIALLAAVAALVVAAPAAATTIATYEDDRFGEFYVEVEGDAGPNNIRIRSEGERDTFVIVDSRQIEVSDCPRLSAHKVRCESPYYPYLTVVGKGGGDRVMARHSGDLFLTADGGSGGDVIVGGEVSSISGGPGDDKAVGGKGGDSIDGGAGEDIAVGGKGSDRIDGKVGADVLRGGDGPDLIDGWGGREILSGGDGVDELDASDGRRDRRIRCGPGGGDDVALIDRRLDPRPRQCETVHRQ
jgi:RTX calcium-binding nonapeptide repeat (4 copies)